MFTAALWQRAGYDGVPEEAMVRILILTLGLTGCAIDGVYSGECTLESGEARIAYEIELNIEQDGDDIGGSGLVLWPQQGLYGEGDIEGSKDGDEVELELKFDEGGMTAETMNFDGTVDGRDISGGCDMGNLFGSFELTRD